MISRIGILHELRLARVEVDGLVVGIDLHGEYPGAF
jgi:hypothetical protein